MRYLWLVTVLTLAGLVGMRPCWGAEGQGGGRKPLVLRVPFLPNPEDPNPVKQADVKVVEAFRKKYPHIEPKEFERVSVPREADPAAAAIRRRRLDVIYVNLRLSDTYIRGGWLWPLDDYVARMSEEEVKARIPERLSPVVRRHGPKGREHVWALPYRVVVRTLWYRKDLFRGAGLDPDKPPRDWKELKEYARQMTNPENGTYGLGLYKNPAEGAWDWITYLWSAGGRAMQRMKQDERGRWYPVADADPGGVWRAAFAGDAAAESMLYYAELWTEKWTDAEGREQRGYCWQGDYSTTARFWADGKIGMRVAYLDFPTLTGDIEPNILGVAPVPAGPTGISASELNAMMFGVFSDPKPRDGYSQEEIREAAWAYIHFWESEDAQRIRTKVLVEAGMGKTLHPRLLRKFGYQEHVNPMNESMAATYDSAVANGMPEPYGRNCEMIYNYMTWPLNEVLDLAMRDKLGNMREEQHLRIKGILERAVERTNEEMLTFVPPEERRRGRVLIAAGILALVLMLVGFRVLWLRLTART